MFEKSRASMAVVVVAACALAVGFFIGSSRLSEPVAEADSLLASAAIRDLQGRPVKLADWGGKPMILNFWATWCAPCREEIPLLGRFQSAHSRELQVVGIAIDEAQNVAKFREHVDIMFPTVVGGADTIDLMRKLGNSAGALPFTLLLDAQGRIIDRHLGPLSQSDLDAMRLKFKPPSPG